MKGKKGAAPSKNGMNLPRHASGGKVKAKKGKDMGKVVGMKGKMRMDRPARASGGKIGKMSGGERPSAEGVSPEKPMSSAAKTEKAISGNTDTKSLNAKRGGRLMKKK